MAPACQYARSTGIIPAVTDISFARDLKSLVRGAKRVVVVGPKRNFSARRFPKLLGKRLDDLVVALAKGVSPGRMGSSDSTLTGVGKKPEAVAVGVLPDSVSRHNSPSRAESIRRVVSSLAGAKGKTSIILMLDEAEHALAAVNAVGRAYPTYSAKTSSGSKERVQILAVDAKGTVIEIPELARTTMEVGRQCAEFVDTPPTDLNPEAYSERARTMLEAIEGVTVEEIIGDELLEHGLGGIHAVGRSAVKPPRMILATYTPEEPKSHIALVGKGVVYDTGGLNLKVGGHMYTMKCDMGGSAAVLGAFCVLAQHGCAHKVTLIMCIAENAIGPNSYKPDDVLHMHSGKTVEINNTDAEGRLLLADGVSWAAHELEVDVVFDAATLTGAQLISLGTLHAGICCNDDELEATVLAAGTRSGDLCHPLLFAPEFLQSEFRSTIADMRNSVANRMNAQTSCAGQFVYAHMEDTKAKWCHVDLAGPAFPKDRGTGYGVALLSQAILDMA